LFFVLVTESSCDGLLNVNSKWRNTGLALAYGNAIKRPFQRVLYVGFLEDTGWTFPTKFQRNSLQIGLSCCNLNLSPLTAGETELSYLYLAC